jgi:hypothetical protein
LWKQVSRRLMWRNLSRLWRLWKPPMSLWHEAATLYPLCQVESIERKAPDALRTKHFPQG